MRKIPNVFQRNQTTRLITDLVTPGCEWVLEGKGVATRKYDGTCCLIQDGEVFKRREIRWYKKDDKWFHSGQLPRSFVPTSEIDPITGKQQGWMPIDYDDKWHNEAMLNEVYLYDGTYELCGPKINNNPEGLGSHVLIRHGLTLMTDAPCTYLELQDYLDGTIEGLVFYYGDLRAKIKCKDFGTRRKK